MIYRMLYTAIPIGTHLQRSGSFADFATSPVLTWDNLDIAKQEADWAHTSVVIGHYMIIDEHNEVVYSTEGQPYV